MRLIILCLFLFLAPGCSEQSTEAPVSKEDKQAQEVKETVTSAQPADAAAIESAQGEIEGIRNPFITAEEQEHFNQRNDITLENLNVSAIFFNGKANSAIIDGKILAEGDSLDGKQVVKIDQDAVYLKDSANTYVARIGDLK